MELRTTFTLVSYGWVDDDLPLTHTFGTTGVVESSTLNDLQLQARSDKATAALVLAMGASDDSFKRLLFVDVFDSFLAKGRATNGDTVVTSMAGGDGEHGFGAAFDVLGEKSPSDTDLADPCDARRHRGVMNSAVSVLNRLNCSADEDVDRRSGCFASKTSLRFGFLESISHIDAAFTDRDSSGQSLGQSVRELRNIVYLDEELSDTALDMTGNLLLNLTGYATEGIVAGISDEDAGMLFFTLNSALRGRHNTRHSGRSNDSDASTGTNVNVQTKQLLSSFASMSQQGMVEGQAWRTHVESSVAMASGSMKDTGGGLLLQVACPRGVSMQPVRVFKRWRRPFANVDDDGGDGDDATMTVSVLAPSVALSIARRPLEGSYSEVNDSAAGNSTRVVTSTVISSMVRVNVKLPAGALNTGTCTAPNVTRVRLGLSGTEDVMEIIVPISAISAGAFAASMNRTIHELECDPHARSLPAPMMVPCGAEKRVLQCDPDGDARRGHREYTVSLACETVVTPVCVTDGFSDVGMSGLCSVAGIEDEGIICMCRACAQNTAGAGRHLSASDDAIIEFVGIVDIAVTDFITISANADDLFNASTYEDTAMVWGTFSIMWIVTVLAFMLVEITSGNRERRVHAVHASRMRDSCLKQKIASAKAALAKAASAKAAVGLDVDDATQTKLARVQQHNRLITYIDLLFPSVFGAQEPMQRMFTEILNQHLFLTIFTATTFTERLTNLFEFVTLCHVTLFVTAVVTKLEMNGNDGTCEALTTADACLADVSTFDVDCLLCTWDSAEEMCSFNPVDFSWLAFLVVTTIAIVCMAPLRVLTAFLFDGVIRAPTRASVEALEHNSTGSRSMRGAIGGFFSQVKHARNSVRRRMSVSLEAAIGRAMRRSSVTPVALGFLSKARERKELILFAKTMTVPRAIMSARRAMMAAMDVRKLTATTMRSMHHHSLHGTLMLDGTSEEIISALDRQLRAFLQVLHSPQTPHCHISLLLIQSLNFRRRGT